ncbi:MAG: T9SS type A sorting domain-containing protein [Bacteroidia bacterium]|nr:T9SS type A sorting domain-containing protein [Bacteroidia bacterium]NNF32372.1 T9SS type A sorting domain-containing protein [Flavobacteriaceae bacterium]NNJ80688.1 T9SS type A sorting domain-containing protein [Flavobacteriaceae bacterium]NNK55427.1 T9SS type A sorting domain-containing protein [Flavobacteriaceae bacterium]NNM09084.1 T9SS type A sorting domain-containing protein [Flavobacteriaceae bacterium]
MKRSFLFISFFILNISFAQPYLPMLLEDHVWNTDFYSDPFGGGPIQIISAENYVAGETIINNMSYKSVYIDGVEGSCLVREDGGIVYRYDMDTSQEYIIYDFTLDVGDTFIIPQVMYNSFCASIEFYNGWDEMTVTDRTTEFIAGVNRVVVSFDYVSEFGIDCKWIEGIGSNLGFDPVGDIIDIGSRYLVCFTKNGTTYFFNNATACDNTMLSVPQHLKNQVVLHPNPVQDISILQLPSELNINSLRIYNITGKLISEENLANDYVTINAMNYPSGLYFYQALSENTMIKTDRFIVN